MRAEGALTTHFSAQLGIFLCRISANRPFLRAVVADVAKSSDAHRNAIEAMPLWCIDLASGRPARSIPAAARRAVLSLRNCQRTWRRFATCAFEGQPFRPKAGQPACPSGVGFQPALSRLPSIIYPLSSISIIPPPCHLVTTLVSIFLPFLELKNRVSMFYFLQTGLESVGGFLRNPLCRHPSHGQNPRPRCPQIEWPWQHGKYPKPSTGRLFLGGFFWPGLGTTHHRHCLP